MQYLPIQRVKRMKFSTELDGEDVEDKRTDYEKTIAAKTTLVESFGARRNLQAIQSAQRNRVGAEALSGVSAAITSRCVRVYCVCEYALCAHGDV